MKSLLAYRRASDLPLQRRVKGLAGKLLIMLKPEMAKAVEASPFTTAWPQTGRLIRNAHLIRAVETGDHKMICRFLSDYWCSDVSEEFYEGFAHRFETVFLKHHQGILVELEKLMAESGIAFQQLIEIGAGDGKILAHFCKRLVSIPELKGVDLNAAQVMKNRAVYADEPRLSFHEGDAVEWVLGETSPSTLLLSNGGVLEYFTREDVLSLFRRFGDASAPCVIVLTESIATDHDLTREVESFPFGYELSLSHHYEALLKEAGFTIRYRNDRLTTPEESGTQGRWIQLIAIRAN